MAAQLQPDLFAHAPVTDIVAATLRDNPDLFTPEFCRYMQANLHVWRAFARLADMVRAKKSNYSAHAVIHVMRWNSDIRDTDPVFKINDHCAPYLARLYNLVRGVEFFRTRDRGG